MSEDEAVAIALSHNVEFIQSASAELQALRSKRSAWSALFPRVSAGSSLSWNGDADDQVTPFNPDPPDWILRGNLTVSWNISANIGPAVRLADLSHKLAKNTNDNTRRRVERDVRKLYLDILLLRASVDIVQERLRQADGRRENAERSFANGLMDEYSMLQTQLQVESIRLELITMQTQLQQLSQQFALLLGLDADVTIEISGSLEESLAGVIIPEYNADALWQRSDVKNVLLQKDIARQNRLNAGYQMLPILGLSYTLNPQFSEDPQSDSWFSPDSWNGTTGVFTISITQNLDPLFPLSSQITNIQNNKSAMDSLDTSLGGVMAGATARVYQLQQDIEKSHQSLVTLELSLNIAQRAYDLAEEAYQAGLLTFDAFEQAELDYRSAEERLLKEQVNLAKNRLDLAYELQLSMKGKSNGN